MARKRKMAKPAEAAPTTPVTSTRMRYATYRVQTWQEIVRLSRDEPVRTVVGERYGTLGMFIDEGHRLVEIFYPNENGVKEWTLADVLPPLYRYRYRVTHVYEKSSLFDIGDTAVVAHVQQLVTNDGKLGTATVELLGVELAEQEQVI